MDQSIRSCYVDLELLEEKLNRLVVESNTIATDLIAHIYCHQNLSHPFKECCPIMPNLNSVYTNPEDNILRSTGNSGIYPTNPHYSRFTAQSRTQRPSQISQPSDEYSNLSASYRSSESTAPLSSTTPWNQTFTIPQCAYPENSNNSHSYLKSTATSTSQRVGNQMFSLSANCPYSSNLSSEQYNLSHSSKGSKGESFQPQAASSPLSFVNQTSNSLNSYIVSSGQSNVSNEYPTRNSLGGSAKPIASSFVESHRNNSSNSSNSYPLSPLTVNSQAFSDQPFGYPNISETSNTTGGTSALQVAASSISSKNDSTSNCNPISLSDSGASMSAKCSNCGERLCIKLCYESNSTPCCSCEQVPASNPSLGLSSSNIQLPTGTSESFETNADAPSSSLYNNTLGSVSESQPNNSSKTASGDDVSEGREGYVNAIMSEVIKSINSTEPTSAIHGTPKGTNIFPDSFATNGSKSMIAIQGTLESPKVSPDSFVSPQQEKSFIAAGNTLAHHLKFDQISVASKTQISDDSAVSTYSESNTQIQQPDEDTTSEEKLTSFSIHQTLYVAIRRTKSKTCMKTELKYTENSIDKAKINDISSNKNVSSTDSSKRNFNPESHVSVGGQMNENVLKTIPAELSIDILTLTVKPVNFNPELVTLSEYDANNWKPGYRDVIVKLTQFDTALYQIELAMQICKIFQFTQNRELNVVLVELENNKIFNLPMSQDKYFWRILNLYRNMEN